VEYKLERFYSPSENKLYEAEMPEDIHGEFEDDLKAFVVYLYYACRVTENKIKKILEEAGIIISAGEISNILTQEKKEELKKEKEEILKVGLEHSNYFHTDDTGIKHKGKNHHVHVICNELFSVFFILCQRYILRKTCNDKIGTFHFPKCFFKVHLLLSRYDQRN